MWQLIKSWLFGIDSSAATRAHISAERAKNFADAAECAARRAEVAAGNSEKWAKEVKLPIYNYNPFKALEDETQHP